MERDSASCCSGDPGTARSRHGHEASSVVVALACTGVSLSSCPSQPPQSASAALTSMLTHPSSSMQTTNPCAGVNPVRRTSARQSQAVRRGRRGNVTRGWYVVRPSAGKHLSGARPTAGGHGVWPVYGLARSELAVVLGTEEHVKGDARAGGSRAATDTGPAQRAGV